MQLVKEELRATVTGVIVSIEKSRLVLEDVEKQIEIVILPSFQSKKIVGSEYLEKKVEIKFLRVKPDCKQQKLVNIHHMSIFLITFFL